jgi:hypothetical protein
MSDLAAPVIEMYVKNEANQDCACLLTDQQHPEPRIGQRAQARVCPEIESNIFWCFWSILQHMRDNFLIGMVRMKEDIAAVKKFTASADKRLHSHLCQVGAGGFEFCFQMLLLLLRRELPWTEANILWDSLFARHALLSHDLQRPCPRCFKWGDIMINRKDTAPNHLVEKHADESPSTLHGAILDLDPKIDTESGAIFRNSGDMLRVLSVASSTALLIMHRKSYLRCQNLPEVVQGTLKQKNSSAALIYVVGR